MARRFKRAVKTIKRYVSSGKKSYKRYNRPVGITPMNVILAGAVYGAVRPHVAKILPDMFSFGPVDSDNVLIGAAGWYGMKKGKGFMKALGTVALASEVGLVSARLSTNLFQQTESQQDLNTY